MSSNHSAAATAVQPSDRLTVLTLGRFNPAWPPAPGEKCPRQDTPADLLATFMRSYADDLHYVAYEPVKINTPTFQGYARLKTEALDHRVALRMQLLVHDFDGKDHQASDEWRAGTEARLVELGGLWYPTANGYHLVSQLAEPFEIKDCEGAAAWRDYYEASCNMLERTTGLVADRACSDPWHIFRLPRANREGKPCRVPATWIPSEPLVWDDPAMLPDDVPTQPTKVVQRVLGAPAGDASESVLYRMYAAAANQHPDLGLDVGDDDGEKIKVACPFPHDSTGGCNVADSSTVIFADVTGGLGAFDCKHGSHGPIGTADVKDWLVKHSTDAKAVLAAHDAAKCAAARAALKALEPVAVVGNDVVAPAPPAAQVLDEKRSDLGNARRLVRMHGTDLRYFMARGCWLTWDGARWRADDTGEITRRAKAAAESLWFEAKGEPDDEKRKAAFKWAGECQNHGRISNMIKLAESEPGIPVTVRDLDSNPWLLNVLNGTLDLRTGELSTPDRTLLMTKVCATPYIQGARSELWERLIADLFGEDHELRDYVHRAMGYALFGAWREKRFWFGYGPPDGGKSTFLGTIGDVLGDYAVSADASTWMLQNGGGTRSDVVRLLGARLVTTLEVRASARFDQQLMKKVTGGDTITARQLYENDIEFAPTFSLWFGANDRPVIPDDDEGFWNRVACVPFTRVVPKERQDKELREKLASAEHAPAVLAWLVEGYLEWQRDGLGTCAAVTGATAAYKRDMNQAARFFDDCCEKGDGYTVAAPLLRNAYTEWCQAEGVRHPLQGKAFGQRIRALGATGNDDESRVGGVRTWYGIRLRGVDDA
jgi:P4 family phage/plasmid primase-like protien